VGHGRQVVDGVGPLAPDDLPDGGGIRDVGPADMVDPDDLVARRPQMGDKRLADKPSGPGDERLHCRSSATLTARR
jgi:hypothetical protein